MQTRSNERMYIEHKGMKNIKKLKEDQPWWLGGRACGLITVFSLLQRFKSRLGRLHRHFGNEKLFPDKGIWNCVDSTDMC